MTYREPRVTLLAGPLVSVLQEDHLKGPLVGIPLQGILLGDHYLGIPDPHHLQSLLQLGILRNMLRTDCII